MIITEYSFSGLDVLVLIIATIFHTLWMMTVQCLELHIIFHCILITTLLIANVIVSADKKGFGVKMVK